jgi:hypothetical protein
VYNGFLLAVNRGSPQGIAGGLGDQILMPVENGARNKVGGVAHWEMISFGDHYLTGGWKQLLPVLLETEGIVALAKNGE